MTLSKITVALLAASALTISLSARDQIKIVGSSTVYPFTSSVAEEFAATTGNPTPVVESTGTGGGMKLFCAGDDMNTPDVTNASRRMKTKEFAICQENGVKNIVEMLVGFDGIAIAQSKNNKDLILKTEQLFLAVAAEVPSKDGKSLIANPYKKWSDIDASLPNREIKVYGPPKSSGTRDSFEEMAVEKFTEKMDVYVKAGHKKYKKIRTDGVYIEAGENDNLIVQKLTKDMTAIGVFGYSFLEENQNILKGASLDGFEPTPVNIASGKYPISRSMFVYFKKSHFSQVKAMEEFAKLYATEGMIGDKGILREIGLIPAPKDQREIFRKKVANKTNLTLQDLAEK